MLELGYNADLKSAGRKAMRVRLPPSAPSYNVDRQVEKSMPKFGIKDIICAVAVVLFFSSITYAQQSGSQGELYVDKEYGFEVRSPAGWFKKAGKDPIRVIFGNNLEASKVGYPVMIAVIDPLTAKGKTVNALDIAISVLPAYEASMKQVGATLKVVEPPHEITVNGMKGARFIVEMHNPGGRSNKEIDCKFVKNGMMISLQGMDYAGDFEKNLKKFEETIDSFKFL